MQLSANIEGENTRENKALTLLSNHLDTVHSLLTQDENIVFDPTGPQQDCIKILEKATKEAEQILQSIIASEFLHSTGLQSTNAFNRSSLDIVKRNEMLVGRKVLLVRSKVSYQVQLRAFNIINDKSTGRPQALL